MLFKHVLHTEAFIKIRYVWPILCFGLLLTYMYTYSTRRPYGVEGEFFVQLFLESEANSDAVPSISDMLHRMFTEQDLSFTQVSACCVLIALHL